MGDLNIGIDISNGDHKQFYIIFNLKFLIKGKLAPQKHINKLYLILTNTPSSIQSSSVLKVLKWLSKTYNNIYQITFY